MNDVFGDPAPQENKGETPIEQPQVETPEPETQAAPPAAEAPRTVPLAALEDERAKRQDWKDKFAREETRAQMLERENRELREWRAQQQGQPQEEMDPVAKAETVHLNFSETMARKAFGDEEVDTAFALVTQHPHIHAAALKQADPWGYVVKEGRKLKALAEIGDDPVAFRARVEAEVRASLAGQEAKPVIPQSLATARSTGARTAPAFNGPPPMSSLFPN